MKGRLQLLLFIGILFLGPVARAGLLVDLDATVFQDALANGTTDSANRSLYGAGIYLPVDSKMQYYLGATFLSGSSSSEVTSGTTTFSNQDIILGFKWFIDRGRTFILSGGYGFSSSASYKISTSSVAETWTGTSTYAKFTVAPEFKSHWNLGMSVIYYSGAYIEKNVSNTTSAISNSRSVIIPGFALAYHW